MVSTKFVVSANAKTTQRPSTSSPGVEALGVGSMAVVATLIFQTKIAESQLKIASIVFLLFMLLLIKIRKQKAANTCQVIVEVLPLGVQVSRMQRARPVRPPLFIPRDVILDVIVNEVILAHKVVSVVLFRILKTDAVQGIRDADERPPISTLMKKGYIHLVPAFPGVQMSFAECYKMRKELSAALGMK
jgi:hypothetical protein